MVDPNELEDVDKEESTEAEVVQTANTSVTEQALEFHRKAEIAREETKKSKSVKKAAEKRAEKKVQQALAKETIANENLADKNETDLEQSIEEDSGSIPTIEDATNVEQPVEKKPKKEKAVDPDNFNARNNTVKLRAFMDKICKDFNVTTAPDGEDCWKVKFDEFPVLKLLSRANCWFGVWREDPTEDNKWRAFRVWSEKEEQETYEHIKEFIRINKE